MWRRVSFGVLVAAMASSSLLAQGFLADQFLPVQPGVTASVFQQLGQSACSESGGIPSGTWNSFLCLQFSCVYSGCAAPVIGDHMSGIDAVGAVYGVVPRDTTPEEHNWPLAASGLMQEIERRTPSTADVILRVPEYRFPCVFSQNGNQECAPGCGAADLRQTTRIFNMTADAVNGYIYFAAWSRLECGPTILGEGYGIVRVSGLPTLLDIILSYQPPSTLSFNVPVRPEGLAGADSFTMYAGDVRHASDLSQAFAMQCTVPAGRPPMAGEQLEVADTLPYPAPGESRYYLAAVNYQGQRRAGRSAIDGVLQGRNAAALPVCQ